MSDFTAAADDREGTEAAIVLYDGNPGFPDMGALWDLAEKAGVTSLGTSAAYISACMKAGVEPGRDRDLSRLRSVGSTGSPWAPEGFDWIYVVLRDGAELKTTLARAIRERSFDSQANLA
jgi:acetoacetyl-CoA synthetase